MKTPTNNNNNTLGISAFLLSCTVLLLSCGGCRSGKVSSTTDISKDITENIQNQASDIVQDSTHAIHQGDTRLDSIFKPISLSNVYNFSVEIPTDDYNVYEHILSFYDKETKQLIKKVDLVKENPFHKMGLKRRKEPYPTSTYFLEPEGIQNKNKLRKFLPQETFQEIPKDFELDRAIATIYESMTDNKYATITYELDWLPDAYSDDGEWEGPGYGVHYVVVYDSLGNKIYTRQFDGTSIRPSVSEDGKYLFTMACLSPEWDENIRYRFTVVNIQTDKVVYEELIDNCKKHGGGGNFYSEFYNSNGYFAEYKNNHILGFTYIDSKLYSYYNDLKFKISSKSKFEKLLIYPDGNKITVKIDSLYNRIKLD